MEEAKLMVVYAILQAILLVLNASPAKKCQHKFQPGSIGLIHHIFVKPDETLTVEKNCREIDYMHENLRVNSRY